MYALPSQPGLHDSSLHRDARRPQWLHAEYDQNEQLPQHCFSSVTMSCHPSKQHQEDDSVDEGVVAQQAEEVLQTVGVFNLLNSHDKVQDLQSSVICISKELKLLHLNHCQIPQ